MRTVSAALLSIALLVPVASAEDAPPSVALLKEGRALFDAKKFDEARIVFERATAAGEQEKDPGAVVEGLALAARTFIAADRLEEAKPWLDRAEKLAKPDAPLGWSTFLAVRGRLRWKEKNFEEARKDFEAAYGFCHERGLPERAVDAANMMAIVSPLEQQPTWARKGIEAAERGRLDGWLGPLWNNLGAAHEEAGRYAEALEAYLKAREYHWKVGKEPAKLAADWAVGHTHRLLGDARKAATWLRPVLAWAERLLAEGSSAEAGEWVGLAAKDLGQATAMDGRASEGLALLVRARSHLEAAKMAEWDAKAWKELLAEIDRLGAAATPPQPGMR